MVGVATAAKRDRAWVVREGRSAEPREGDAADGLSLSPLPPSSDRDRLGLVNLPSSTHSAAAAMRSGNAAISPSTGLGPTACISAPAVHALDRLPTACAPQDRDWSAPDVACGSPRARSTTSASMTTSEKAMASSPAVMQARARFREGGESASKANAAAPPRPQRTRYGRRRSRRADPGNGSGCASLTMP